jgi:hypothetical protein
MNSDPQNNISPEPDGGTAPPGPAGAEPLAESLPADSVLDAELPPVEPPSGRFIAQLFLIPSLIVAGIVGLFLLFSYSGSQTQDWQTLVVNIGRDNPHRRGRAFHDLVQLLNSGKTNEAGIPLSLHPPLATALAELTSRTLALKPTPELQADHLQQEVLLVRLLGLIDVSASTLPVLATAISTDHDPAVRQAGLLAIAAAGKRAIDRKDALDETILMESLESILAGQDADLRRDASVALGVFSSDTALDQLESLLNDSDPIVRYNAASSLVRQNRLQGLKVFRNTIREAALDRSSLDLTKPKTQAEVEAFEQRWLLLQLSLKAVGNIADSLPEDQRATFQDAITPLAGNDTPDRIRIDAKRVLQKLAK